MLTKDKRVRRLDKISRIIYPLRILGFLLIAISSWISQSKLNLDIGLWGIFWIGVCLVWPHIAYLLYFKNRHHKTEHKHMILDMGLQGAMTALTSFNPIMLPYLIANSAANYALYGRKQAIKAVTFAIFSAILIGFIYNVDVDLQISPVELIGPYIYLIAVTHFMAHLTNTGGYLAHLASVRNTKLLHHRKIAEKLSQVDFLTGLNNRRAMFNKAELNTQNIQVANDDTTLIMIDLDHFKGINDQHGHDCGDAVLVQISKVLKSSLRGTDIIARWGGEEFLVLMPKTNIEIGLKIAETIRQNIDNCLIKYNDIELHITATLGVASYGINESFEETTKRADEALYSGKEKGRNRVVKVSPYTSVENNQ